MTKKLFLWLVVTVLLTTVSSTEAQQPKVHRLKTAKALGLTIPPTILYRADRVIK